MLANAGLTRRQRVARNRRLRRDAEIERRAMQSAAARAPRPGRLGRRRNNARFAGQVHPMRGARVSRVQTGRRGAEAELNIPVSVPAARGAIRRGAGVHMEVVDSQSIRITKRERLRTVIYNPDTDTTTERGMKFKSEAFRINPASNNMPWLQPIAQRWVSYQFEELEMRFTSALSTEVGGQIAMGMRFDAINFEEPIETGSRAPQDMLQAEDQFRATIMPVWAGIGQGQASVRAEAAELNKLKMRQTSIDGSLPNSDAGFFYYAVEYPPEIEGRTLVGTISVKYTVILRTPVLKETRGESGAVQPLSNLCTANCGPPLSTEGEMDGVTSGRYGAVPIASALPAETTQLGFGFRTCVSEYPMRVITPPTGGPAFSPKGLMIEVPPHTTAGEYAVVVRHPGWDVGPGAPLPMLTQGFAKPMLVVYGSDGLPVTQQNRITLTQDGDAWGNPLLFNSLSGTTFDENTITFYINVLRATGDETYLLGLQYEEVDFAVADPSDDVKRLSFKDGRYYRAPGMPAFSFKSLFYDVTKFVSEAARITLDVVSTAVAVAALIAERPARQAGVVGRSNLLRRPPTARVQQEEDCADDVSTSSWGHVPEPVGVPARPRVRA